MTYLPEPALDPASMERTGILLINLGTPEAPTRAAVRRYLAQFLADPRVVEIPRVIWWPILHGIILNTRPTKSAAKYARIWRAEGSPLRLYTERQAQLLKGLLGARTKAPIKVAFAMRYGEPSIAKVITDLKQSGCTRLVIVPLYPQYAASTTASALDGVFGVLERMRNVPAIRVVRSFHDHPAYIAALAASVRRYWAANGRAERLVMSFHGLPAYTRAKGDPYYDECRRTGQRLAAALQLDSDTWTLTFQSRFGRTEWLKPYTSTTLEAYARQGVRRVDVVCPGFVADCLETLEEIGIEGRELFGAAGGESLGLVPCLNDDPQWIEALEAIVREPLAGWITAS